MTNQQIHDWLLGFDLDDQLHVYVAEVVGALPNEPRDDLIGDPSFRVSDYDAGSGRTHQVPIGVPGRKRPVPIGRPQTQPPAKGACVCALCDCP